MERRAPALRPPSVLRLITEMAPERQLCDWACFQERGYLFGGFDKLFPQLHGCLHHILLICRLFVALLPGTIKDGFRAWSPAPALPALA